METKFQLKLDTCKFIFVPKQLHQSTLIRNSVEPLRRLNNLVKRFTFVLHLHKSSCKHMIIRFSCSIWLRTTWSYWQSMIVSFLQEEKEQLIEYKTTVASLVGRAKTVVQLRPRSAESMLSTTTPIRAICDYRQIEVWHPAQNTLNEHVGMQRKLKNWGRSASCTCKMDKFCIFSSSSPPLSFYLSRTTTFS